MYKKEKVSTKRRGQNSHHLLKISVYIIYLNIATSSRNLFYVVDQILDIPSLIHIIIPLPYPVLRKYIMLGEQGTSCPTSTKLRHCLHKL